MKKFVLMIVVMMVFFTGCKNHVTNPTTVTLTPTQTNSGGEPGATSTFTNIVNVDTATFTPTTTETSTTSASTATVTQTSTSETIATATATFTATVIVAPTPNIITITLTVSGTISETFKFFYVRSGVEIHPFTNDDATLDSVTKTFVFVVTALNNDGDCFFVLDAPSDQGLTVVRNVVDAGGVVQTTACGTVNILANENYTKGILISF